MELELGLQEKVKQELEVGQQVIFIYLLMLILTNFSKDLKKIYFLNAQYLSLIHI